eukprot:g8425.t1
MQIHRGAVGAFARITRPLAKASNLRGFASYPRRNNAGAPPLPAAQQKLLPRASCRHASGIQQGQVAGVDSSEVSDERSTKSAVSSHELHEKWGWTTSDPLYWPCKILGVFSTKNTNALSSARMLQTCLNNAESTEWYTDGKISNEFLPKLLWLSTNVWLMSRRLLREGERGKRVQEFLFDELWRETKRQMRSIEVSEIMLKKYLAEAQQHTFMTLVQYDHAYTLESRTERMDVLTSALWNGIFMGDASVKEPHVRVLAEYIDSELADIYAVDALEFFAVCIEFAPPPTAELKAAGKKLAKGGGTKTSSKRDGVRGVANTTTAAAVAESVAGGGARSHLVEKVHHGDFTFSDKDGRKGRWRACLAESGKVYYWHTVTREYGFWVPASKELQYGSWAPASKNRRFGGDSRERHQAISGRLAWSLFSRGQPYNVVLTHLSADFDSLAAAVGVAKLWNMDDPEVPTYVVLPRGAHPSVSKFLALHLEVFPILGLELLDPTGACKVGVCDAQTRDRVGPASELLDQAEVVHVYDHHIDKDSDIVDAVLHIEHVGAATTMVTEMIRAALERTDGIRLTEAESTLLALGIHADTGSLTYDSATARDAAALAWLMTQGCQQTVVSEYTHTSLSAGQQSSLVEAFRLLAKRRHNGISVGSVLLVNEERVAGMARVAQNLLDMSEVGVLLVGEMHPSKPGRAKDRLGLIGRVCARIESVDFNALFKRFGAGGHPKAAAASIRLTSEDPETEARDLIEGLVETICKEQILEPELVAEDFMTSPVLSCQPSTTLQQAEDILRSRGLYALPVVGQHGDNADKLLGLITRAEISKAFRKDEAGAAIRPVTGFMLTKVIRVCPSAPMHKIRQKMAESTRGGRAVVVDQTGRLRGIITRTDLLRQFHFYRQLKQRGQAPSHREWIGAAAEPGEALTTNNADTDEFLSAAVAGFLG